MDLSSQREQIRKSAQRRYTSIETIWRDDDPWHMHTLRSIRSFIDAVRCDYKVSSKSSVLNVGSAGIDHGFFPDKQLHVDIVETLIKAQTRAVVADVELLPFRPNAFDHVLCVGSVVNYCSILEALTEIHRVLATKGVLVLEYETTSSFEYIGTSTYQKDIDIVDTFYQGQKERIWIYSDKFVSMLLNSFGLVERRRARIHILSPLAYRLTRDESVASRLGRLDGLMKRIPWVRHHASNVIVVCQKTGQ